MKSDPELVKEGRKTGGWLLTVFLCVLIPALSFYAPQGYYGLGEEKFRCFKLLAGVFAFPALFLLFAVIAVMLRGEHDGKGAAEELRGRMKAPDFAALSCAVLIAVSWCLAADRGESLWGTSGWRMGALTQLLMLVIYASARCFGVRRLPVITAAELSSGAVFLFAVLNRYGIYPFSYMSLGGDFLSTIGNIDWYAGYLAVFLPLWAGDLVRVLLRTKNRIRGRNCVLQVLHVLFLCLGLVLGIWSALTQGTDSCLLSLGGMAAVLLIAISGRAGGTFGKAVSAVLTAFICFLFFLCLLAAAIHACAESGWGSGVIAWLYYKFSVDFRAGWGNGRGAVWRIAGRLFRDLPFRRKLFGIGPDGFAAWEMSHPAVADMVSQYFGPLRLTNAHCGLFTALIDEGALYAASLAGFYLSFLMGCLRAYSRTEKDNSSAAAPGRRAAALTGALLLVSCAAGQMFTFRTVVSEPFLWSFAGILMTEIHSGEEEYDIIK